MNLRCGMPSSRVKMVAAPYYDTPDANNEALHVDACADAHLHIVLHKASQSQYSPHPQQVKVRLAGLQSLEAAPRRKAEGSSHAHLPRQPIHHPAAGLLPPTKLVTHTWVTFLLFYRQAHSHRAEAAGAAGGHHAAAAAAAAAGG